MTEQITEETVTPNQLDDLQEIDMPTYDFQQHIGAKTTIRHVNIHTGEFGRYLKVESDPVGEFPDGKEIRASQIFSLVENPPGNWGWGKESKLAAFLLSHGVEKPVELIEKSVVVQIVKKKDGRNFLTFA